MAITTNIQKPQHKDQITIYPNPSNGKFNIKSENEKIISIDIYNSIGDHLKTVNSIDEEIDLSGFSKGIYLIKINTPKGTYTNKLIKQ